MTEPLRTRVPYRHDRWIDSGEDLPALPVRFRSHVPVRPARVVFQGHPRPHTAELARWIHDRDPRPEGERRESPPRSPFAYRGHVAARPEEGRDITVHLWEEPSGRPLEAELPRGWFRDEPYKGMPFLLVTWMEDEAGSPVARGRIERVGIERTEADGSGEETKR